MFYCVCVYHQVTKERDKVTDDEEEDEEDKDKKRRKTRKEK